MIHQPVSVVSQCGADVWLKGLAGRDQRRTTGSGSALEALRDDALDKSTATLLYFTIGYRLKLMLG